MVAMPVLSGCSILGGSDDGDAPFAASTLSTTNQSPTTERSSSGVDPVVVTAVVGDSPDNGATSSGSTTSQDSSTSTSDQTTSSSDPATTTSSTATTTGTSGTATSDTTASAPSTTRASVPSSSGPTTTGTSAGCRPTATLCVGPDVALRTLTAAVARAGDGAVIELAPGRYNETVAVAPDGVTIRSAPGGRATVDCSGIRPAEGKACILAVGTNLTVEDLVVTGARGPDDNEACFRNEPGTRFTVRRVECFGSNNGILGSGGSWIIEDSHFHGNGAGDGQSHNLYLSGDCSEVVFRRSISEGAVGGHAFKSRCRTSTIEASTLRDNQVADAAEFSYGGAVTIRGTTIEQPDGANGNLVRHGAEGCRHGGALTLVDVTLRNDRSAGYIRSACAPVELDRTALPPGVEVVGP